jgi:phage shock protein A
MVVNLNQSKSGKAGRTRKPQPKTSATKTESKDSGGKVVAEKENGQGMFEAYSKMSESVFSLDGVKKAAAWYIETSEKLANQVIDLQEKATGWAKETPLAALFEAQNSFARKVVERSASAARNLWRIQPSQHGFQA